MWLIDEKRDLAMSFLPKCGTHSLREIHVARAPVDNSDVLGVKTRVGWLRHPRARHVSAWSFFHNMWLRGEGIGNVRADSYKNFVDQVLSENNDHWAPQVELLTHEGMYLPTITHRFETINETWSRYYRGFIPWANGCIHEPTIAYRSDELREVYKVDEDLWQSLQ